MRYLVTGGVGFLGTNLCLRLLEDGNEIVALDDLSTGFRRNVEMLSKNKRFKFIKHDIVKPLPDMGKFDFIYNLACPASPPRYQKDPVQTLRTSLWGVWNVLQYADATPVFHSSTSEVYGDPLEHPQKEAYWGNVNPIGIRSCYDEGKRAAETLLMDYHRTKGVPVKIVRIFNTYGPCMDPEDGRVVSNFITQTIQGNPLTIFGTGKQTRSFCYVDDLVDGFLKMEKAPKELMGPINLGNPKEFTLLELAALVEKLVGKEVEKVFVNLPVDDPKHRRPDISLARKALGWEPKTELADGLEKTIDYFKKLLGHKQ